MYLFIHRSLHSEGKLPEGMSPHTAMTLQALGNGLHECSVQSLLCLTHLYLQCKWNPQLNFSLPFYLPAVLLQLRLLYCRFSVLQDCLIRMVWLPLAVFLEYECYFQVPQLSPRVSGHFTYKPPLFFSSVTRVSETITSSAKNGCMYQVKLPSKCGQYGKGIWTLHCHNRLLECLL